MDINYLQELLVLQPSVEAALSLRVEVELGMIVLT